MAEAAQDGASTAPAVALDDEAKRLQLEQVKAEARKAIAQAQQATLQADLPSPQSKPLEGTVTLGDKAGLVAQIVARAVVEEGAREIAGAVAAQCEGQTTLIVEDRNLLAGDWRYALVRTELTTQRDTLAAACGALNEATEKAAAEPDEPEPAGGGKIESLGPGAAGGAAAAAAATAALGPIGLLAAAPAVIGGVADVVGMFRSNYTIAAADVQMGATPLVAGVAGELRRLGRAVVVDDFRVLDSPLIGDFFSAREQRLELERQLAELAQRRVEGAGRRIDDLRADRTDAAAAYDKALCADALPPGADTLRRRLEQLDGDIAKAEIAVAPWRALQAAARAAADRWDAFATAVVTAGPGDPYPPLVAAARRERLHANARRVRRVLYVGVEGTGGETITRRSLFRSNDRLGIVGGAQLSWLLLDAENDTLLDGGTKPVLGQLTYDLDDARVTTLRRIRPTRAR